MKEERTEITCKICKKKFIPKNARNRFCSRECFKQDYYLRKKEEKLLKEKYPIFTCKKCGYTFRLDFDPTIETFRWLKMKCPICHSPKE